MLHVKKIVNDIFSSNCYVLYCDENKKTIVIDPGSIDCTGIVSFIKKNNLRVDYVFLTHSHFDHIAGVNSIKMLDNSKIVCSRNCGEKIIDPKKNMSFYSNFGDISSPPADILIEDIDNLFWNGLTISFFKTLGHSDCCISISIGNWLFTGDTLLKGIRSLVAKPWGDRLLLNRSLQFIYNEFEKSTLIYPGHGDEFLIEEQDITIAL